MSTFHSLCRIAYDRFGAADLSCIGAAELIDHLATLQGMRAEVIADMRALFAGQSVETMLDAASRHFEKRPLPVFPNGSENVSGE